MTTISSTQYLAPMKFRYPVLAMALSTDLLWIDHGLCCPKRGTERNWAIINLIVLQTFLNLILVTLL